MTVILDTTVYYSDPNFKSTEMIKLRQLCEESKINLVIPQIVHDEYKSQEEGKFIDLAKKFLGKIETRSLKSTCPEEKAKLDEIKEDTKKIIEKCKESVKIKVDSFVKETKATVKMLTLDEFNKAFEKYFQNDKPFPLLETVNSREDIRKHIPDSLIFVQVLNHNRDDIIFISNDKNLRESVRELGVTSYSKLSEFIESDKIKAVIDYRDTDEFLLKYFTDNFNHENEKIVTMVTQSLEKELYYKQFNDRNIPDDNYEGTIIGINDIVSLVIENETILNLGSGLFSIPFSCVVDTTVDYYIFKADYYCLDRDRTKDIYIEDWNDHYFRAEEDFLLSCTGKIGIQFSIAMSEIIEFQDMGINDLLSDIKISFSELDITIE